MAMSIESYDLPYDSHNRYDVTFYSDNIHTLVTHTPSMVDAWLSRIYHVHRRRLHRLIVGLDVEWRPNNRQVENPVATLQLCVGRSCLIFQLIYAPLMPPSLIEFLRNDNYTFVGIGIQGDVEKLLYDYQLVVANAVDLRVLAAERTGMRELINAGLTRLVRQVLGKEVYKPKSITMSRWDREWLTDAQVQYACLDAFLSFEIGRCLDAAN